MKQQNYLKKHEKGSGVYYSEEREREREREREIERDGEKEGKSSGI